jgi:hypothetical protein
VPYFGAPANNGAFIDIRGLVDEVIRHGDPKGVICKQ